jgi:hypothetical protein
MQDVSHNNLVISAVSWKPQPQSHVSISDGVASDPCSKVTNLSRFFLGILYVLFQILLITANVRSGGTMQGPALLRCALSVRNCHPIVLNRCRCHGHCSCRCLCQCCALHWCSAWTIPCNVPHLMASVPLLSMSVAMLLTLRTTTIALTADITGLLGLLRVLSTPLHIVRTATIALTATALGLPELLSLLIIPLLTHRPQLWEHGCHL